MQSSSAKGIERTVCGEVLASALDIKDAAHRLGVSAPTVHEMVVAGDLAALRLGGVWRLPAWQFGTDRLLPGVRDLLRNWPGSFLSLSIWACTPSSRLQGRTPAQALTSSNQFDAIRHALAALLLSAQA
jgi:excisionase family DNA binding protein